MKNSTSKIVTIAAAVLSIVCFFNMNVVQYSSEYGITGGELFKYFGNDMPVWPILYILIPFLVGVIRFGVNVEDELTAWIVRISGLLMLIPFFAFFLWSDGEADNVGPGVIIPWILVYVIIIISFITRPDKQFGDKPTGSKLAPGSQGFNVRQKYNEGQMYEIISKPSLYSASLVEECRRELKIRQEAESFMGGVKGYPDTKIREILSSPNTYSDAVVYCCEKVWAERLAAQRKVEAEKWAEEQQRRLRKRQQTQEHMVAWWKKNRIYVFIGLAVVAVLSVVLYINSDGKQYEKGVALYEQGNIDDAIHYLEKVGTGYKNAPNAYWLLYKAYLSKDDKPNAAKALATSTDNKNWNELPEAYEEYTRRLVYGTMTPHIPVNLAKAAELMESAGDTPYLKAAAGELYFKCKNWEKALLVFDNVNLRQPDALEKRANAFAGTLYLFGLGGQDKNVEKAAEYYSYASCEKGLAEYMMAVRLAMHGKYGRGQFEKIAMMADVAKSIGEDDLTYMGKIFAHAATNFMKARERHKHGDGFWSNYDSGWHGYDYNNGRGYYYGEYTGNIYGKGGANGWGCFLNKMDEYYYASVGKYTYVNGTCPLNGEGVMLNYYDEENRIICTYGIWQDDKLQQGNSWSNDEIDEDIISKIDVQLPF